MRPRKTRAATPKILSMQTLEELWIRSLRTLLLAGDLNARIGHDSNQASNVVGHYLYHDQTNENGERLVEFCQSHRIRDAQACFLHRHGRIRTWKSPKGSQAQLDHIFVSQKWLNSVENCRAYNTVFVHSDHRIVCARLKVKLTQRLKVLSCNTTF